MRKIQIIRLASALLLVVCGLMLMPVGAANASWASPTSGVATQSALRVGLQVGHWKISQLPDSLSRLRGDTGTAGAGRTEVQYNLDMAQRTAALLRAQGIVVDILPATVPNGYRADAFVAIHADGNVSTAARGYKIATRWRSSVVARDMALLAALDQNYGAVTGLPRDSAITRNMRGYYAINTWLGDDSRVSDLTPAAIIETGYMTNRADRAVLFNQPDVIAAGIARGIVQFLSGESSSDALQQQVAHVAATSPTQRSVLVMANNTAIRTANSTSAPIVARASRGDVLTYLDNTTRPKGPFTKAQLHGGELAANAGYIRISYPGFANPVYISRDSIIEQDPVRQ